MKDLTIDQYRDLIYALLRAMEVMEKEENPRLERIKQLFREI